VLTSSGKKQDIIAYEEHQINPIIADYLIDRIARSM